MALSHSAPPTICKCFQSPINHAFYSYSTQACKTCESTINLHAFPQLHNYLQPVSTILVCRGLHKKLLDVWHSYAVYWPLFASTRIIIMIQGTTLRLWLLGLQPSSILIMQKAGGKRTCFAAHSPAYSRPWPV